MRYLVKGTRAAGNAAASASHSAGEARGTASGSSATQAGSSGDETSPRGRKRRSFESADGERPAKDGRPTPTIARSATPATAAAAAPSTTALSPRSSTPPATTTPMRVDSTTAAGVSSPRSTTAATLVTRPRGSMAMAAVSASTPVAVRRSASVSSSSSTPPSGDAVSSAAAPSGYNSDDEHRPRVQLRPRGVSPARSAREERARDQRFEQELREKRGFYLHRMKDDGNCLFRAISDQVYGDQEMHDVCRRNVMDFMEAERDHYSQFVTEDFDAYLSRKRRDGVFGNHLEIQAMAELYNRPIEVFSYSATPINIFQSSYSSADHVPMRLSYHRRNHYNSVIDPSKPAVGLGLGMPALTPGTNRDKSLVARALKQSESEFVDHSHLRTSLSVTDWEATEDALAQAVMAASRAEYLESLRNQGSRRGAGEGGAAAASSSSATSSCVATATTSTTATTTTTTSTGGGGAAERRSSPSSSSRSRRSPPRRSTAEAAPAAPPSSSSSAAAAAATALASPSLSDEAV